MSTRKKYSNITKLENHAYTVPNMAEEYKEIFNVLKEEYQNSGELTVFNEEINREWSIETGMIEGVYSWDKGITETFIKKGFNADFISHEIETVNKYSKEVLMQILRAQEDGLEKVFAFVKEARELNTSFMHELHQLLLRHQETVEAIDSLGDRGETSLLKGKWKTQPNNPSGKDNAILFHYAPPEIVASEMDNLIAWYKDYAKDDALNSIVLAAWLHHRFVLIHPYQDGNGRMARALASIVLIKGGYLPLIVSPDTRGTYIDALEAADGGDLQPLVTFIANMQIAKIAQAFDSLDNAEEATTIDEAITEFSAKIANRNITIGKTNNKSTYVTDLNKKIMEYLSKEQIATNITQEIQQINSNYRANLKYEEFTASTMAEVFGSIPVINTRIEIIEETRRVIVYCVIPKAKGMLAQVDVYIFETDKDLSIRAPHIYNAITNVQKIESSFYCLAKYDLPLQKFNSWLQDTTLLTIKELYKRIL